VTRQRLTALLKRAGLRPSKWNRSGQIKGWGHSSEGYKLSEVEVGERYVSDRHPSRPRWYKIRGDIVGFTLEYYTRDSLGNAGNREEQKKAGMERVKAALRGAGVSYEEKGDGLFVPAPPAT
jgi:hypothetical protein